MTVDEDGLPPTQIFVKMLVSFEVPWKVHSSWLERSSWCFLPPGFGLFCDVDDQVSSEKLHCPGLQKGNVGDVFLEGDRTATWD